MAHGSSEKAFHDLDVKRKLNEIYADKGKKQRQREHLEEPKSYQAPNCKLFWSIVSVGGKGTKSMWDEIHLQNSHNAAVMLNVVFHLSAKRSDPYHTIKSL